MRVEGVVVRAAVLKAAARALVSAGVRSIERRVTRARGTFATISALMRATAVHATASLTTF